MMVAARPGPNNLITDVAGISVGCAADERLLSGVSVVLTDKPATAAVDVRGGAPGTRETEALDPSSLVGAADAVVLSGGSVFGLDAASGVTDWLSGRGRGYRLTATTRPCPIVPAAILFDLANGGDKDWGAVSPYRALAVEACETAGDDIMLGNSGAGFGAVAGAWKGGLGSASVVTGEGITIGALMAVNSFGSPVNPATGALWAAPFAQPGDLGDAAFAHAGGRVAPPDPRAGTKAPGEARPGTNTTVGVVACDARLNATQACRIAIMAQDGIARAIRPAHAPVDGDIIFALSTGRLDLPEMDARALGTIGTHAGDVVARAIARAVWEAAGIGGHQSYRTGPG